MKKSMKRVLTTVMVATSALLLLAGCGGEKKGSSDNKNVKLDFWAFAGAEETKFYNARFKEYHKLHPNVTIKLTKADLFSNKVTTALATGTGPDLFKASAGTMNAFVNADVLAPLNDIFSKEMLNDYSKASIEGVTYDKKILAMPVEQEVFALFYDADLLEKNGIEPPKTFDELRSAAKKLTTDKRAGILFEATKGAYENIQFMPFVWSGKGDFFDKKGNPDVTSDAVVDALTFWRQLVADKSVNLKPVRGVGEMENLSGGAAAFIIAGSIPLPKFQEKYPNFKLGVTQIPVPNGGKAVTAAGGWNIVANARGKHVKEVKKFMKWLFLDENGKHSTEWNTKTQFTYSPRQSVIDGAKDVYQSNSIVKKLTEEIYPTARPELAMDSKDADVIGDMIQNAIYGKMTPKEAAADAQKKLEANRK